MSLSASQLWNAWRESPEIRELAEGWMTKPLRDWTPDDQAVYGLLKREPDKMLAVILAVLQQTEDEQIIGSLAAGPLESFLGAHGEAYLETMHSLALEHQSLRLALDGVWQGSMPKRVWRRIELLKQSAFS